ncbi:MAG: ABC transporter permease, partial [Verrucomicrobiota bacterium]
MNLWTISLKSIRHYWRTHLGVWLGLVLSAAVLTGAVLVGDSVRYTLNRMALNRIGDAHFALLGHDRFFRSALADAIATDLKAPAAPIILIEGSISVAGGGGKRANHAQVLGIDSNFWSVANLDAQPEIKEDTAWLNQHTADYLNLKQGDRILVRFEKPSALPRDAPLSEDEDLTLALRFEVAGIFNDDSIGRFSLQANQIPPFNVFLPMDALQKPLERPGGANLILIGQNEPESLTADDVQDVINRNWQLKDAELSLVQVPEQPFWELRTDRIFIDEPIEKAVLADNREALPILTYFVNEFKVGEATTPYSMITAWPAPLWDGEADGMDINTWLADDLKAKPGDEISIKYYIMGPKRTPIE